MDRKIAIAIASLLTLSITGAGASEIARTHAGGIVAPLAGTDALAVSYTHRDCVGPGLPGTATPHVTHTDRVTGFSVSGGIVRFSLSPLAPLGAGICPTTAPGPILKDDFTGTWRMTAVCRGSLNDGTVFFDWEISAVAGLVQSQGSTGSPCIGYVGTTFDVDVTIEISATDLFGIPLDPLGGITLTMTQ